MEIIIDGQLTDLNTYIKALNSHRQAGNAIKQEETTRVWAECKKTYHEPISAFPVHITYDWYSPNQRKDTDNVAFSKKFINDGLVQAGILPDDSRKYVAGFTDHFHIDKKYPRVVVTIHSLSTGGEK